MRWLLAILIILCTLYAPLELTRVILDWAGLTGQFAFEVIFIWVSYAAAVILLWLLCTRR